MKKMLMTLAAAFFAVSLLADTWTDPDTGYTWTYTITGDGATIYNGGAVAITPAPSGGVTIPPTLGGKPVTAIGQSAFLGCGGLTSIDIPDTVTSIGDSAFANCVGLSDIYIPASVTSVHKWAFDGCSGLEWVYVEAGNANYKSVNGLLLTKDGTTLVQGIGGGVTIPDGVTTIGDCAFYGCDGLWSITIPSSVTTIENNAFGGCVSLASVVIPSSVTSIGSAAFASCDGLERVTLPQADVDDFDDLFNGYAGAGLKVVIADGVTSIPDGTFKGCDYIKSVLIPGSVTTIGVSAFEDCDNLDCLSICSGVGVTTIKANAFKGCTSLEDLTIPSSVETIEDDAFKSCDSLANAVVPTEFNTDPKKTKIFGTTSATIYGQNLFVEAVGGIAWTYTESGGEAMVFGGSSYVPAIPKNTAGDIIIPSVLGGYPVTKIGRWAFGDCDGITGVTIPSSVTEIDYNAFNGCDGLESIVIPSSVTAIGNYAFYNCANLKTAIVPTTCSLGTGVFDYCHPSIKTLYNDVNVFVTLVDGILWTYTVDGAGNATLGDGYGAPAVPTTTAGALTIPASLDGHPVTAIGESAFSQHSDLTSVTIPSGVTEIGEYAFRGCDGLKNIVVPQSVTICGDYAFAYCSHLNDAVMPEDLAPNESTIFSSSPTSVNYKNVNVAIVDGRAWIYTVDGSGNATVGGGVYMLAIFPDMAFGDIAIPSALGGCLVTAIGDCAFSGCDGLTSVTIPDGVEVIEVSAFEGCSGLTSVTMPNSLTTIGEYAFEDCTGLTDVTIPEGVTAIEDSAFCNCTGLSTVTISSTVSDIHPYAFDGCGGLTAFSVAPGNAVYSSSNGLLLSKDGKTLIRGVKGDVTIPDGVEIIGESAFYGSGLTSVAIPLSVTTINEWAFGNCNMLANVVIPASVTSIGAHAFIDSTMLTDVSIPASVTSIGEDAFLGTPSLTTVHVEFGNTDRAKGLLEGSGKSTTGIMFIQDVPPTYTVTFDANGGSVSPATRLVTANMTVGELPVPTRVDYTFKGWFTAAEDGEEVAPTTVVKASVTFYAQWTKNEIDPESLDPFDPGDLPCYDVLNPADIWDPFKAPKAVTLTGALYYGCDVVGIVELKVGKMKDYQAKVSGTVTLLDGKKYTIKSQKCGFGDKLASSLNLDVKGGGRLKIAIGSMGGVNVFSGSLGKWHVQSAKVGGSWGKNSATFSMDTTTIDSLPSGTLEALLPTNEVATAAGGKWKFKKAASVKWTKVKAGVVPLVQDATTGKGLVVDTSKDKTNRSGLKLTYTPKKGTFKGTFKLYELKSGKLKKYTVNVSGVVVDGVGYGKATSKKPVIDWPVTIK